MHRALGQFGGLDELSWVLVFVVAVAAILSLLWPSIYRATVTYLCANHPYYPYLYYPRFRQRLYHVLLPTADYPH